MTEARLSLLQAHPINLGPQTPLWDLVQASAHHRADAVALSFSASSPAPLVLDTLAELRQKLAPRVALWAGGRNALLQRRPPDGVLTLDDAASVASAVQDWRRRNAPR
jgi:Trk K+ transport system NAD-binding subunit